MAVPLSVPAGSTVEVTLGAGDRFVGAVRVHDADDDGSVRLFINTYLAANGSGRAAGVFRAAGSDTAVRLDRNGTTVLTPGTYRVESRRNGSIVGARELQVTDPAAPSVAVFRGVPRVFEVAAVGGLREANRRGLVRPLPAGERAPEVVRGETVVVRFDAPGFLGAVAAQPGNSTAERFLALHEDVGPETAESVEISGPCGGIHLPGTFADGGARVLAAPEEGAVYLLLDTERLAGVPAGTQRLVVDLSASSPLVASDRTLETSFLIDERTVSVPGNGDGLLELSASERERIRGTTNLLPDTRVQVIVRSTLEPRFVRRATVTVRDNGTFVARVDLANASDPGLFTVTVAGKQFPARMGDAPGVYWDLQQGYEGDAVYELYVDRLRLPRDGFLVAYTVDRTTEAVRSIGTTTPDEDVFYLEAQSEGRHLLIVAHRDGDGDGTFDGPETDPPYRVNGSPVAEWLAVTAEDDPPPARPPSVSPAAAIASAEAPTRPTPTGIPATPTRSPRTSTRSTPPTPTGSRSRDRPTASPSPTATTTPGFEALAGLVAVAVALTTLLARGSDP